MTRVPPCARERGPGAPALPLRAGATRPADPVPPLDEQQQPVADVYGCPIHHRAATSPVLASQPLSDISSWESKRRRATALLARRSGTRRLHRRLSARSRRGIGASAND